MLTILAVVVVLGLLYLLGRGLFMAGGDSEDLSCGAFPQGENSVVCLDFYLDSLEQSKTDHVFQQLTLPFKCKAVRAEYTGRVLVETNAITFNIEDDTATPQVVVSDFACAGAITNGTSTVVAMTVDATKILNAGAILKASYTSGASDTASGVVLRLWVHPI